MQNAFRIAGCSGCIDGISRIMIVRRHKAGKRLHMHNILPVVLVELCHTFAIPADIIDTVRRIGVLNERPGCPGFPHADHGNDRKNASGQVDQDKILLSNPLFPEPGTDLAGHLIKLRIGDALGMRIIKENRHIRIFCCVIV